MLSGPPGLSAHWQMVLGSSEKFQVKVQVQVKVSLLKTRVLETSFLKLLLLNYILNGKGTWDLGFQSLNGKGTVSLC